MINPMRILVCLVLNWTFLEIISRFCATLCAIGCTYEYVNIMYTCIYIRVCVWMCVVSALKKWRKMSCSHGYYGLSFFHTLQHTTTHCNTLQHAATRCNTLQYTAMSCPHGYYGLSFFHTLQHTTTHCNTLQHIATRCNELPSWILWSLVLVWNQRP